MVELLAEPAVRRAARSPIPAIDVVVRYEDDDVVVVAKPAGLVVHPGAGHPDGTLVNGLLARYPEIADVGDPARPGIVHRLDRDTSGLLVVARSQPAYDGLVEMLAAHDVERRYDALVWGVPDVAARRDRRADRPVGAPTRRAWRCARAGARRAPPTRSSRRTASPTWRRLECRLETGRTHQIRVHLAGHRPPGGGRRRVRRPARRRSRSTARSSTPAGWRSRTRSPASRSRWRSRSRPSSRRCSTSSRAA